MSIELQRAYIMGYEDCLERRSPDPGRTDVMDKGTCPGDRETCHDARDEEPGFTCSECDCTIDVLPYFCPNCGRRVVE